MSLAELLDIRTGVTAVIGSGGKTTLLRTLGEELSASRTVLLCTTTKIFPFPDLPCAKGAAEISRLRKECRLLCAGREVSGKLTAPDVPMAELASWFDYVLVEADGAARRPLKAHAAHEPVIPREAEQTICVVGASGFGRPIREAAHRPELYAELAGVSQEALVVPKMEAAVLNQEGLHQSVFINQVETAEQLAWARELAALLTCPVLAGSLWKGEYMLC